MTAMSSISTMMIPAVTARCWYILQDKTGVREIYRQVDLVQSENMKAFIPSDHLLQSS